MAGAKRGKRGAPAGEANQREHKRQREAEPKLDYFPSTSMPLQGWFQPCRYCRFWTAGTVCTADGTDVPVCQRCQGKLAAHFKRCVRQLTAMASSSAELVSSTSSDSGECAAGTSTPHSRQDAAAAAQQAPGCCAFVPQQQEQQQEAGGEQAQAATPPGPSALPAATSQQPAGSAFSAPAEQAADSPQLQQVSLTPELGSPAAACGAAAAAAGAAAHAPPPQAHDYCKPDPKGQQQPCLADHLVRDDSLSSSCTVAAAASDALRLSAAPQ